MEVDYVKIYEAVTLLNHKNLNQVDFNYFKIIQIHLIPIQH